MIGDEHLYLTATKEAESEVSRDPALWAKCMALCEGSNEKAKYMYIKERVEALRDEETEELRQQTEIEAEKEKERLSVVDLLIQELKRIKCYASVNENGAWVVYGPGDDVRNFRTYDEFINFSHELLPSLKIDKSQIPQNGNFTKPVRTLEPGKIDKGEKHKNDGYLRWDTVWRWVAILYSLSLIGFLIKVSSQMGGLVFQNIWQFLAVVFLPAIHMFWFGVVAIIYLTVKQFKLEQASNFLRILAWAYVILVVFRLISGRPI